MARSTAARLHRLTALQVQTAGDGDHADGGGLVLRVQAGRGSWVFKYTAPSGRRREMGLGVATRGSRAQAGESLSTARDLAHRQRELLRQDKDPIEAKAQARVAALEDERARKAARAVEHWTLARAARDYHERVIEPNRTAKHSLQWIASLENHVPAALWHRPLDEITAPELLDALLGVTPHERARNLTSGDKVRETVRRIRQRLDAVYEDAMFRERATHNPAAAVRRKMRETEGRQARRQWAALPYGEAPALVQRLREVEGVAARALEFAILTTARTGEVLGAEWSEFDLPAALWIVPAARMKAREPHAVFLPARAVELLQALAGFDSRFVFVSPTPAADGTGRPLSNMAMLALLDRLGVRDRTTAHGLCRATFSTWANETGAARPDVVEACLAHREGDRIRAAYNRARFDGERRALLQTWAEYLSRPAAPVAEIRRAAGGRGTGG